jgi:hypothetical protein
MELAFFLFPVSFALALVSAVITGVRWKSWPLVDRWVGLAPLLLFSGAVIVVNVVALVAVFGG